MVEQATETTAVETQAATEQTEEQATATGEAAQQAETQGWLTQLPKDMRDNEAFKGYSGIGELADAFLDLHAQKDRVFVPGDEASDEEKQAYRNAIGVPESDEGYKLVAPEMPEGVKYNTEIEKAFRAKAHELGLNGKQAKVMHEFWNQAQLANIRQFRDAQQEAYNKAEAAFKKEWGEDVKAATSNVKKAMDRYADDDIRQFLTDTGLGSHPSFVRMVAKMGADLQDDTFVDDDEGSGEFDPNAVHSFKSMD